MNQVIFLENLAIQDMMEKAPSGLAGHIQSSGFGNFVRMLKYKGLWLGKAIIQINRYDASSKMCSECGHKNEELKLADRSWTCSVCGTEHDRDVNAAKNVLKLGMERPEYKSLELENKKLFSNKKKPTALCCG